MAKHYPYLLIGGGMAADAAARGIRQVDEQGTIGLIGKEEDPPYNRPPLSKGLWKRTPLARIWRRTADLGVDIYLGRRAIQLDTAQQRVIDDQNEEYTYDRLLLATGGRPIQIGSETAGETGNRVIYYRTLADYRRLRALMEVGQRFVVIGGGFIGSEMAAVLASQGKMTSMIFPEEGIGARVLPFEVSQYLNQVYRERGVDVRNGRMVESIEQDEEGVTVRLTTGEVERADSVVAGLGIRPSVELAEQAGLEVDNGIRVNESMQSSDPNIFAAGDVISFYSTVFRQWVRVEHEENTNLTGMLAGQGMAGQPGSYEGLPSVYSTIFDISYDAVGLLDPRLEVIYDWQEPFQKGVMYYTEQGRVRGVILWNVPRGLDAARKLIREGKVHQAQDLTGQIRG